MGSMAPPLPPTPPGQNGDSVRFFVLTRSTVGGVGGLWLTQIRGSGKDSGPPGPVVSWTAARWFPFESEDRAQSCPAKTRMLTATSALGTRGAGTAGCRWLVECP